MLWLWLLLVTPGSLVLSLKQASYSSDWRPIQAGNSSLFIEKFTHNIAYPVKVDVQVRATSGPNAGFVFPCTGSMQEDDDDSDDRGGVVCLYNENKVHVIAPLPANDGNSGYAIHTGNNERWIGENYQRSVDAEVRVRVWGKNDFPEPAFISSWRPIDEKDHNYTEIEHGLGDYPVYVNLQVRLQDGYYHNWIVEGIGAAMVGAVQTEASYRSFGGVLFAYSNQSIRVWTPTCSLASCFFGIFTTVDGFEDQADPPDVLVRSGTFRVQAWTTLRSPLLLYSRTMYGKGIANERFETTFNLSTNVDFQDSFVVLETEAVDGDNIGFRFRGDGFSQDNFNSSVPAISALGSYGGVIYGYSLDTFRLWRPADNSGGYIIHVGQIWGGGTHQQMASVADVIIRVWLVTDCLPTDIECGNNDFHLYLSNSRPTSAPLASVVASELTCASWCHLQQDCVFFTSGRGECELYSGSSVFDFVSSEGYNIWSVY